MDSENIRLFSGGEVPPVPVAFSEPQGWWTSYKKQLAKDGLSETSVRVVDFDSQYIVERGIFGAGEIGSASSNWPATRTRRGLVMGAVQSGKTASLIAVIAKALDRKVDIVVVLGGTRTALWRQTYERVIAQLDQWTETVDSDRRAERVLLPSPTIMLASEGSGDLENLYFETPNIVRL